MSAVFHCVFNFIGFFAAVGLSSCLYISYLPLSISFFLLKMPVVNVVCEKLLS